ncbi:STYKc [Musa troglodytarum]|uniref:STYKc n=1 Tax=Musa troglodytarum TaxID=320322 RepID=A0A9E7K6C4_9LILI|nr:STYKc [Musa troglodytarum]
MDLYMFQGSQKQQGQAGGSKFRQTNISDACDKEIRGRTIQHIARFFYQAAYMYKPGVVTSRAERSSTIAGITVDKSVEFSYEELARATDDFSLAYKIGGGGFGVVYYAELRGELHKAAIKKMDMQATKEFLAELKVLTNVHHLNLVSGLAIARVPFVLVVRLHHCPIMLPVHRRCTARWCFSSPSQIRILSKRELRRKTEPTKAMATIAGGSGSGSWIGSDERRRQQ